MACIDKENLLKDLITIYAPMQEQKDILVKCIKKVNEQPTADVEEVKHGYWKHRVEFGFATKYHFWNCSLCGVASEDEGNEKYCRECGAKMDGVRKSDL